MEEPEEDAALRQPLEQIEDRAVRAVLRDEHLLHVRGGDEHRLARLRQLVEDHLAIQIATGEQAGGDGAHPRRVTRPRVGRENAPCLAATRSAADTRAQWTASPR